MDSTNTIDSGAGVPSAGGSVVRIRRGDVLVVGRILSFRTWARALLRDLLSWRPWNPFSFFPRGLFGNVVSWRIQHSTRSQWNHVACYLGDGEIAEAEWNRGVRIAKLRDEYCTGEYRVAVIRPPAKVDRALAITTWREIAAGNRGIRSYSLRTLLLMRVAALLFGPEGIRKVVRNNPDDGAWICSELGAVGWNKAGLVGAMSDLLITPADFLDETVGLALELERVIVTDPRNLALED